jgi:hypothetical protein
MDKNAGKNGKKAVIYVYYRPKSTVNSLRSLQAISVYEFPIVTALYPRYVTRKVGPETRPNRDLMKMMSMKNFAFTSPFHSPYQGT